MTSALERAILGPGDTTDPEPHAEGTVVEGVVRAVSAKGMTFTVPDWDDGKFTFGPAPYPRLVTLTTTMDSLHTHDVHPDLNQPSAGDRCLVVFVGEGVSNPWVVATWPK